MSPHPFPISVGERCSSPWVGCRGTDGFHYSTSVVRPTRLLSAHSVRPVLRRQISRGRNPVWCCSEDARGTRLQRQEGRYVAERGDVFCDRDSTAAACRDGDILYWQGRRHHQDELASGQVPQLCRCKTICRREPHRIEWIDLHQHKERDRLRIPLSAAVR